MPARVKAALCFSGLVFLAGCGPDAGKPSSPKTAAPAQPPAATSVAPAPAPVSTAAPAYEATLDQGIQFEKPGYPTFIQSAKGMSKFEPTHRWTEGPVAVFTFAKPLPTSFVLRIDSMWAFGPNAGKPVTIRVGDWQGQAAFGAERSTVELKVKTATPATSIEFTIPAPTSPQQAGLGADPRMLGIALKRLSITPS